MVCVLCINVYQNIPFDISLQKRFLFQEGLLCYRLFLKIPISISRVFPKEGEGFQQGELLICWRFSRTLRNTNLKRTGERELVVYFMQEKKFKNKNNLRKINKSWCLEAHLSNSKSEGFWLR